MTGRDGLWGLVDGDGLYTNLAWLLPGQCTASIKAAVFERMDKLAFTSREEFSGSLFSQFRVAEFDRRRSPARSRRRVYASDRRFMRVTPVTRVTCHPRPRSKCRNRAITVKRQWGSFVGISDKRPPLRLVNL